MYASGKTIPITNLVSFATDKNVVSELNIVGGSSPGNVRRLRIELVIFVYNYRVFAKRIGTFFRKEKPSGSCGLFRSRAVCLALKKRSKRTAIIYL